MKRSIFGKSIYVATVLVFICFCISACKGNGEQESTTTSEKEYYEEFVNILTDEDVENAKKVAQAYYNEGKAELSDDIVIEEIRETIAVGDYRHAIGIINAEKLIDSKEITPGNIIVFQSKAVSENRIDYRHICLVKNSDNMWNVIYEML